MLVPRHRVDQIDTILDLRVLSVRSFWRRLRARRREPALPEAFLVTFLFIIIKSYVVSMSMIRRAVAVAAEPIERARLGSHSQMCGQGRAGSG